MLIIAIGFFTGILCGMAIGGGTLLVPALVFLQGVEQHMAQGVSLASFLPNSAVAVATHYRQGNVELATTGWLVVGTVLGAIIASYFVGLVPSLLLRKIFGGFLIFMGLYELSLKNE